MWGRRHVSNRYRSLAAAHHRTRCHNVFSVARWDPETALRQKAQAWLRALHPVKGEALYVILDDSPKAQWGQARDAVAKMQDATTDADIRGHHEVCGTRLFRQHVIPGGLRR